MYNYLQLFSDAGSVVNASIGFPNAYGGESQSIDKVGFAMEPTLKTFYDTELLENARSEMKFAQFGKKMRLPKRHGTTVEWRRWNTFKKADVLVEGVIPAGQKMGMSSKTASIFQVGTYATISDKLELHAYDDVILGATEEMGASAAETQETLIRDALLIGTNVLYCDNLEANGAYKNTPTSCATMGDSASNGYARLTPDMVNKAFTKLTKKKAQPINGKFYAIVHPSVVYDLRSNKEWIEVHKYAATEQIFNGEIGELHNVRFIVSNHAPVLKSTGYTNKDSGATYATFFFGKEAFGVIDPEGGALEMIVHDKDEIGGPLNQFSTIGYKMETNGATILYPERVLRVMSTSAYSATDEANTDAKYTATLTAATGTTNAMPA